MEENQFEKETQKIETENSEPETSDNSEFSNMSNNNLASETKRSGGESKLDPQADLILGKFKSVEDLSKAYNALEKHQGECSEELGSLRKEVTALKDIQTYLDGVDSMQMAFRKCMERDSQKYNTPEYLQDPTFKELYTEALFALGDNLDTDRLVTLVESYVGARIRAYDKKKAEQNETGKILDSMTYSDNPKSSIEKPKKTLDEMTDEEFKAELRKLIQYKNY